MHAKSKVTAMNELEKIAELLRKRNQINFEISRIIGRPALTGHIGEYITSRIFKIKLEYSAVAKGVDGVFIDGALKGKTVNIKLYGKQESVLDITTGSLADYYLVLTGPKSQPVTSRGSSRPLVVSNGYLFNMTKLVSKLRKRGVKIGIATSVAKQYWEKAEIYPHRTNDELKLTTEQTGLLKLFGAD